MIEDFSRKGRGKRRQNRTEDILDSSKDLSTAHVSNVKEQIGNQLVVNREPIGNQLGSQKAIKKESIGNQEKEFKTEKTLIGNQLVAQKVTRFVTKKESIGNQLITNWSFKHLTGIQKVITIIIFNDLKFSNSKITKPISLEYLAEVTKTTKKTAKTAVQRLVKKYVIRREEGKRGKGGWAIFSIDSNIYNEMLHSELITNWGSNSNQLGINWEANRESNKESSPPSSSSSININTTTEDPSPIDLNPIETINFSRHHLKQIQDQKILSDDEIQKSIDAFSFDLANGHLGKIRSPLNFFMKILKNGSPYVSDCYQDPEDLLLKEKLVQAQREKSEKERMKGEYLDLKFNEWLEEKGRDELEGLVSFVGEYLGVFHRAGLKDYFRQEVFDEQN